MGSRGTPTYIGLVASRPTRARPTVLDATRGRTDASVDLRRHLSLAPASYLSGAIDNPALNEEEVMLLLRNRSAPATVLARIARDRRWTRSYEVKKAIARHPRTPLTVARSFLPHFYWRDLAEIAEDARMPPSVKKQAEEVLKHRVAELTQGERIALARRASRGVITALRDSAEPRVLQALLSNVRLVENDAVRIASNPGASKDILSALADHPEWRDRFAVRLSLLSNSKTPVAAALRLIAGLSRQELSRLARDAAVPKIVRVGADRQLEARTGARSVRRG